MHIIDTHAHIYAEEFENDIDAVIERAKSAGLKKILMPNIDLSTVPKLYSLADKFLDFCIPMMGLHPTCVARDWESELGIIEGELNKRQFVAIGEIGIDLYWDKTFIDSQKVVFEKQLQWAIDMNLPAVVHSRDAVKECVECVRNVGEGKLRGVFHSFGGDKDDLNEVLSLSNFMIGVNGVVTFKNSGLDSVIREADLSRIVVETDSPFLTPAPFRGKRNEPAYTAKVVNKLAELFELDSEVISEVTTSNAEKMFSLLK